VAVPYNSNYDKTIPFSDVCAQVHIQANAEQTYTVPGVATNKYSAHFSYTAESNVFVRLNGTPTIPAGGSVGTQQYNEFRPGDDGFQRYVQGGDVIHFITPDTNAYVGVSLRTLQGS
jgi:hypothetical protein